MNKEEIMIRRDYYGKFDSTIKEIKIGNERWRYSVSGYGNHYILALMSNVAGHVKLFKAELKLLKKKDLLLIVECMEDFLFNYTFDKKYYQEKAGKILLLNSPTDRIVNPRQEKAMHMLCPQAQTYQFKQGGHTSMLTCPEEYYEVVKHFLLE